jgi:hypothetical protein
MRKIASPADARSVLTGLVTYCKGPRPSRQVLASELRYLADRVAYSSDEAKQFREGEREALRAIKSLYQMVVKSPPQSPLQGTKGVAILKKLDHAQRDLLEASDGFVLASTGKLAATPSSQESNDFYRLAMEAREHMTSASEAVADSINFLVDNFKKSSGEEPILRKLADANRAIEEADTNFRKAVNRGDITLKG